MRPVSMHYWDLYQMNVKVIVLFLEHVNYIKTTMKLNRKYYKYPTFNTNTLKFIFGKKNERMDGEGRMLNVD